MTIQVSPSLSYIGALHYERLPEICYACGRIGHIQVGCFYQPREVEPMEIPYEDWIIADIDPSQLLWSSYPNHTQQRTSTLVVNRSVHLTPDPPPPTSTHHLQYSDTDSQYEQQRTERDYVEEN